ncbi:MAG: virulence RhuM family protein [Bacteroidaceae bacterium]|nr:virulence RhuM family protein [Bacteroidaceae bacterium]
MNKNDQIIIYQTEDGQTQVDVRMENETVWLTQAQMAELFQTDRTSIVRHINNIYKVEELERESTCAKIAQLQIEGNRSVTRQIPYFNLDMIISVGYRVNAKRGVQFRRWANKILKEYLVKGYAVNDRLRRDQLGELRQLVQVVGRTLNQIYLENYALHKVRPYAPTEEGTGTMMTAGGCKNCEQSFLSFPKYVVSSQRISI